MSIYSDDLANRFPTYTFTENLVGSSTRIDADNGGPVLNSAIASTTDLAYEKLRSGMVGGAEIFPQLTTAQRDTLTPGTGTPIYNSDNLTVERYDGTSWFPENAILEGNYNFQGLTKIGGDTAVAPNGALDIIGSDAATTRIRTTRFQDNDNGGAGIQLGHSRGSESVPSALLSGDKLGQVLFVGDDGTSVNSSGAFVRAYTSENWSSTAKGCQIRFETIPNGGDNADVFVALVVSENGYPEAPEYTVATLPSVGNGGGMIMVTDETGGYVQAFSDGTNWRRSTDRAIVS